MMSENGRFLAGIDVGAETIKYVVFDRETSDLLAHDSIAHEKSIESVLRKVLSELRAQGVTEVAVCGRFANHFVIQHYPRQAVIKRGLEFLYGPRPITCVMIGANGFCVMEHRDGTADVFRENSRCSQGTGNFLRQLVERFDMNLAQADVACENVEHACALSGRCPVISMNCSLASKPTTAWNSLTIIGKGCGPITEPRQ